MDEVQAEFWKVLALQFPAEMKPSAVQDAAGNLLVGCRLDDGGLAQAVLLNFADEVLDEFAAANQGRRDVTIRNAASVVRKGLDRWEPWLGSAAAPLVIVIANGALRG